LSGTRGFDGTTNAAAAILAFGNNLDGANLTLTGTGGLASSAVGTQPITSTNTLALGGSAAANYTLNGFSGSVIITSVQATTSVLVGSTNNPSGYNDSVVFTAAIQTNGVTAADASGSVVFLTNNAVFDTETLSGGVASSLSLTNLPRGTNTITVQYAGDVNYLGSTNNLAVGQVVTNHPPVANASSYSRPSGFSLKIPVPGSLSTNWSDVDGDTVTLLTNSVSSTDNATMSADSNFIYYNDPNNVADLVNYMVSDGHGGTNAGVINITIAAASTNQTQNITGITSNPGGSVTISFASVPNSTNVVQRSPSLAVPDWTDISTNMAGTNGLWQYTDPATPPNPSFYRSKRQP
jgi:Bacterial Ig-like domain (group 3)/YDG domain